MLATAPEPAGGTDAALAMVVVEVLFAWSCENADKAANIVSEINTRRRVEDMLTYLPSNYALVPCVCVT
jgi:hypothetical protein